MDNELIVNIGDKVLKFKLKSQAIVTLEKTYGKNIFEIFQDLSFTSIQNIFWESLLNKEVFADRYEMMDALMDNYTLIELSNTQLQELAVKSGILRSKDLEEAGTSAEETKNY